MDLNRYRADLGDAALPVQARLNAAWILGRHGSSADVPRLIQALQGRESALRAAAAQGLGHLRDASATDALGRAVGDPLPYVRLATVWALGEIGDPRSVESLIRALGDGDLHVRALSVCALGHLGDPRAVQHVAARGVQDPSRCVRLAGVEALELLGSAPPAALLEDPEWAIRLRVVETFGRVRLAEETPVLGLIKCLEQDPHPLIRARAAWALGEIGDSRAVTALQRAAGSREWPQRAAAARAALDKIKAPARQRLLASVPFPLGQGPGRRRDS